MNKLLYILTALLLCSLIYSCQEHTQAQSVNTITATKYKEKHRLQFHFSPAAKWMNDPNGMFFFEDEYHLFYQYYPDSTVWGPMHWGHAISTDLVHWQHMPIALYPDSLGYIFSGSAVVDWKNTSGFGKNDQPPIIAIFTHHNMSGEKAGRSDFQYQSIAYSNDRGRTWTKYEGNPVVPNPGNIRDFRDPKVIWDDASNQWVMVFAAYDHVKLYGSKDLKTWQHLSDWGKEYGAHKGVWECPDLFPINVEGSGEKKWVLLQSLNPGGPNGGSGTQYFVGDFDGEKFTLDPDFEPLVKNGNAVWLDFGRDNYAGVTWSDVPKEDGRRLYLGWMSNWDYATVVPTDSWRSATTLPRSLILKKTGKDYRLYSQPVKELETLRSDTKKIQNTDIASSLDLTQQFGVSPTQTELVLNFETEDVDANFGVEISNGNGEKYRIGYDAVANQFYSDRTQSGNHGFSEKFAKKVHTSPRISKDKNIRFHLFFDTSSAELFADGGATVMTDIFFPGEDFTQVKIFSENGKVKLLNGEAWSLKSIWH
jgi:fructan beta-fructosidase